MTVTIWHNPRCSKSRATLKLLEEKGVKPEVRLYLEDPPSADEIARALAMLGLAAGAMVRRGEAEYREAGIARDAVDADLIDALAKWPKLIERPIVFAGEKAAIGRPPEAVLDIL